MCFQIKKINWDSHKKVQRDVMQHLDRLENEFLPQVSLDVNDIRFDDVKFIEPQTRIVTVTNTGQVRIGGHLVFVVKACSDVIFGF